MVLPEDRKGVCGYYLSEVRTHGSKEKTSTWLREAILHSDLAVQEPAGALIAIARSFRLAEQLRAETVNIAETAANEVSSATFLTREPARRR